MSHRSALILTIVIVVAGITICTALAQTAVGQGLLNLLNVIAFFLGIAYMVYGGRHGNLMRIGAGLFLCISAFGVLGLPEPLNAGLQLFLAIGGLLLRLP